SCFEEHAIIEENVFKDVDAMFKGAIAKYRHFHKYRMIDGRLVVEQAYDMHLLTSSSHEADGGTSGSREVMSAKACFACLYLMLASNLDLFNIPDIAVDKDYSCHYKFVEAYNYI
ncbi:hypothetical protein ACJX0J_014548, partial [Zea mays]